MLAERGSRQGRQEREEGKGRGEGRSSSSSSGMTLVGLTLRIASKVRKDAACGSMKLEGRPRGRESAVVGETAVLPHELELELKADDLCSPSTGQDDLEEEDDPNEETTESLNNVFRPFAGVVVSFTGVKDKVSRLVLPFPSLAHALSLLVAETDRLPPPRLLYTEWLLILGLAWNPV